MFAHHFQGLWDNAAPAQEAVAGYEQTIAAVCSKLKSHAFTDIEIRVYSSLLRMGASTPRNIQVDLMWADREDTPSPDQIKSTLRRLINRGLVERHKILNLYLPKSPQYVVKMIDSL